MTELASAALEFDYIGRLNWDASSEVYHSLTALHQWETSKVLNTGALLALLTLLIRSCLPYCLSDDTPPIRLC